MTSRIASFRGTRVLVTAGAGGAGRVIAERFTNAGARVYVCDIDADAIDRLRRSEPRITASELDVGDEGAIDLLFDRIDAEMQGLDVLVNNAGIAGPTAPAEEIAVSDWERTLRVNLGSHFLCARRVIPGMKKQSSGVIINISSASSKVGLPLRLPYVVSKAAVLSLTQNLARELGPFNIRVNAILPGAIEGDRLQRVIRSKAAALKIPEESYRRELLRFVSMRSTVSPDDIAETALFLASDAARRITGQMIGVDGNLEYEA